MTDKPRIRMVVHADDLGLSLGINNAILRVAREGWLSSSCLRVNGPAYESAVNETMPQMPGVGMGVHLNIVEGKTRQEIADGGNLLFDQTGQYIAKNNAFGFWRILKLSRNSSFLKQVEADFRNQIEIVLADGVNVDHLNSHQHSHGIPGIFEIVCRLANDYDIPYVRVMREPFYIKGGAGDHVSLWYPLNLMKWAVLRYFSRKNRKIARGYNIKYNDYFLGILYTSRMNFARLAKGLESVARTDRLTSRPWVEALFHPAEPTGLEEEVFLDKSVRSYVFSPTRNDEMDALQDFNLASKHNVVIEVVNYKGEKKEFISDRVGERSNIKLTTGDQLKIAIIINETPFYHPRYVQRLIEELDFVDVVHVYIVKTAMGGALDRYMLRNITKLKIGEIFKLASLKYWNILRGALSGMVGARKFGSVRAVCRHFGIAHTIISEVKSKKFKDGIRGHKIDLVLSANELIFDQELLDIPRYGCINRHSSLLPSYGGILPVFRAVQFGESFTGVSVHKMTAGIDEGDILSQKYVPIMEGDTLNQLYQYCFDLSFDATKEALSIIYDGSADICRPGAIQPLKSYYSFPNAADWREFRKRGGRFI